MKLFVSFDGRSFINNRKSQNSSLKALRQEEQKHIDT